MSISISSPTESSHRYQARYVPDASDDSTLDADNSDVEKIVNWDFC